MTCAAGFFVLWAIAISAVSSNRDFDNVVDVKFDLG
jgi:hypothetical protein